VSLGIRSLSPANTTVAHICKRRTRIDAGRVWEGILGVAFFAGELENH
jgi:hypothetical protein